MICPVKAQDRVLIVVENPSTNSAGVFRIASRDCLHQKFDVSPEQLADEYDIVGHFEPLEVLEED
jgi:hypothetical protein